MDLSDEEPTQVKRPVFKKKKPKGAKAVKRVYEEESDDPQKRAVSTAARSNSKAMEKALRYRSLKRDTGEESDIKRDEISASFLSSTGLDAPMEVSGRSGHSGESGTNTAYTVLPDPAKTFSLRESHFRDKPVEVEKEYEDEDGWSEPERPTVAALDESDHEMDVPNVEYTTVPSADPDQYFMEIPGDDEDVEMEDVAVKELPGSVSEYIERVKRDTREAEESVARAKQQLEVSRKRIEVMEEKKKQLLQLVLEGSEAGFGGIAGFIKDLYRQGSGDVVEVASPVAPPGKEDVDMMSLFA
ncbi:hypothetical protein FT663_04757 [Candidozyma haemuli var. vulneris]|nr:hypothetical protein FT663_04757 [[Candida] haemuloni var. vulneris]KAF3987856.1 hypothetical protein FT662_03747 [[Candida] haemuloni var. vulneris]